MRASCTLLFLLTAGGLAEASTYVSPDYPFSFTYPATWVLTEKNPGAPKNFEVGVKAPGGKTNFRADMSVFTPIRVNGDGLTDADVKLFTADWVRNNTSSTPNFKLIGQGPVNVGGLKTWNYIYTATFVNAAGQLKKLKAWQTITVRNGLFYNLGFISEEAQFLGAEKTFKALRDGFQFR